jgi:hypothetical protein
MFSYRVAKEAGRFISCSLFLKNETAGCWPFFHQQSKNKSQTFNSISDASNLSLLAFRFKVFWVHGLDSVSEIEESRR